MMTVIQEKSSETIKLETIMTREISVEAGAHLDLVGVITDGWEERRTITVHLSGDSASVSCVCIFVGGGKESFPLDIEINHEKSHTKSSVRMRTILDDTSAVDSEGRIRISSNAKNSDTYFSHHALLVAKGARAKIIPALEIENDDVRAGHAVTVGRVDEEVLFYCAARGVNRHEATQLITRGFLLADMGQIREKDTREYLEHKIDSALNSAHAQS